MKIRRLRLEARRERNTLNSIAGDLIEMIPRFLLLIRRKVKEHAASDLTMPQLRILSQLKVDALSNSELADRCGLDITSMSRMANNLIKRGFITRTLNRLDRRCVKLQLSVKGRREQEAVSSAVKDWLEKEMGALTRADQDQLTKGLKILEKLEGLILGVESSTPDTKKIP